MKLFVVVESEIEITCIIGIYSTQKKADEVAVNAEENNRRKNNGYYTCSYDVQEFILDE